VCLAHWQSDTTVARMMASATFARLQTDPTFAAQLGLARTEMAQSK
jgi:acid phosphatase (class A)